MKNTEIEEQEEPTLDKEAVLSGSPKSIEEDLINLINGSNEMPIRVYGNRYSYCCRAKRVFVRSREGGFVTLNCEACGHGCTCNLSELPENCPKCKSKADRIIIWKNYGYKCPNCGTYEFYTILFWYHELFPRSVGVGIPGIDWER